VPSFAFSRFRTVKGAGKLFVAVARSPISARVMKTEHNLCMPDDRKACAACCGLYNVTDGTRATLLKRLVDRTRIFHGTERTVAGLCEFESREKNRGNVSALDDAIHVCEFVGFIDADLQVPGCMLHPQAPGNGGIDLRGMCHYGSLACRSFYCPAWEELDPVHKRILVEVIDDWHLYGLVIVDLDFVNSLFGLLEQSIGRSIECDRLLSSPGCEILKEMLLWKDSRQADPESTVRRSLYYNKGCRRASARSEEELLTSLLQSLECTLGAGLKGALNRSAIKASLAKFRHYYEEPTARCIGTRLQTAVQE
jgi:hypothetical protein